MKNEKTTLILGGFLTLLVMLWFVAQMHGARENSRVARTDTNVAMGLKVFSDLKEKLEPGTTTQWRRPFLKKEDLERFDTLFIVSPKIPLSEREEDFVVEWVEAGGKLVVTAENDEGVTRIKRFLTKASISHLIDDTPGFKNGRTMTYEADEDSSLFRKGETYEAYSPVRFQDSSCLKDPAQCWIREGALGKGSVTLLLGLSPMSNAMIDRADNKKIAARLALGSKRAAFDEYHLLVTEKTTGDLLVDPSFALPVLGMLIGILLYFVAGSADRPTQPSRAVRRASSWHDFGRKLLARTLEKPGALREAVLRHARFFAALAPKEREAIDQIVINANNPKLDDTTAAQIALRLATHHRNWLKSKGRK